MPKKTIKAKEKVKVISQFDDPAFEVKQEAVECKHQNQGDGKCFDCNQTLN